MKQSWYFKIIIFLVIIGIIIYLLFNFNAVKSKFLDFLEWLEDNPLEGAFLYILIYVTSVTFFIPGSIMTLGGAFAYAKATDSLFYGMLVSGGLVFISASLGAILAYTIARYVLRDYFKKLGSKNIKFKAIEKAIEMKGIKLVFLLRVAPIVPYCYLNYLLGITSISPKDNILALLGMIPGVILYVYIGGTLSTLSEVTSSDSLTSNEGIILMVIGTIIAILGFCYISFQAKKIINELIKEEKEKEQI